MKLRTICEKCKKEYWIEEDIVKSKERVLCDSCEMDYWANY